MNNKLKKEDLRILFMGTPEFARTSLDMLVENEYNIVGVFCQPDKPKGRGMHIICPPVKECATRNGVEVCQLNKLKNELEIKELLTRLNPNLIIVVAYGKILPKFILDFPKYGCINIHGSLLPKYRGAAPIQWSIINSDDTTGITTMYMDEGMDTGDMILKKEIKIEKHDTYGSLHDKLMLLGAEALNETLDILISTGGTLPREKQSENFTIAPMLSKDNSKIDFDWTSDSIIDLVRGTNPFPAAWCKLDDNRTYKIYEVEKIEYDDEKASEQGQIVFLNDKKNMFVVKCKDGYINILRLKAPGTREMTSGEYIRGGKIKVGEKFI